MKNLNLYFFILIGILGSNIIFSQVNENITYQDYNNYIYSIDRSMIERFGSQRNQMVVKIYNGGNRQYLVTYMDIFTQKMIEGPYNGNQHSVVSFERFKEEELERRKRREKERLEEIELERKKEEERKRKIREEKIKKEKEKINRVRTDIFSESYRGFWSEFKYYFFLNGEEPTCCEKTFTDSNLIIEFTPNDEFIKRDVILTDEIEEIGKLRVSLEEDPNFEVFEITFGVKNLHDDSKIRYYVDGLESKYDFGLKGKRVDKMDYNPLNHLINFYSIKRNVYKEFSDKFNLPFNTSIEDFNDLNQFSRFYKYLKFLNEMKHSGINKELVNYTIIENLGNPNQFNGGRGWYPTVSIEVIDVEDSKKTFSWVLKEKDLFDGYEKILIKYTYDKKRGIVYRQNPRPTLPNKKPLFSSSFEYLNQNEVIEISKGNYKYSSVMNSN